MKEFLLTFFNQYGVAILYAVLTAVAGCLAAGVKKIYERYVNDATKRKVARTVVMAVEQIYKDLNGPDKFDLALKSVVDMLNEKGITITMLEARMLIEAAVGEFNGVFYESVFTVDDDLKHTGISTEEAEETAETDDAPEPDGV